MPKQAGMVAGLALIMVLYLIWQDPTATADLVSGFFEAVFGFLGTFWDKLGEFLTSLAE